ncbi:MAG: hypothetical protein OEW99_13585, partial [Gammaproteobacteria bacterium]|nr:hypothetical protein [Gammaproteobacteria bacterium]
LLPTVLYCDDRRASPRYWPSLSRAEENSDLVYERDVTSKLFFLKYLFFELLVLRQTISELQGSNIPKTRSVLCN